MKYKEEFLKEIQKRIKENIDVIESSFQVSNQELIKTKLFLVEPIEFHLSVLLEDDPYIFLGKLEYGIINKQEFKVGESNIACHMLLELVNLILDEFQLERIDKIES